MKSPLTIGLSLYLLLLSCQVPQANEFRLHEDFSMSLVACEPLVFDPVDMEFDAQGRAFVLEMPGYPWADEPGRLVLLLDHDQDAVFDQRIVFSEDLGAATSLLPYKQGFLIAAPPDILYVADLDGDFKEDHREVILSGFEVGNTQHNFNGLTYGLDNWIYAANGGNDGSPFWPDDSSQSLEMRGQDFRFKIDTRELQAWGRSSGGFELAMDSWGRLFETHNIHHISHLVMPSYYQENVVLNPRHSLENISDHEESNGLARVYPVGLQETRVNHPEQSGYFSGACGITYYGGGAFPENFEHNIFVADVVLNVVHRDVVIPNEASFTAQRKDHRREFLASTDRSFRPVNLTVGPDGALYVLDMHRLVIEHPEWIPDEIEKALDLKAGKDQGRIYRIVPKNGLLQTPAAINTNDLQSLLQNLAHPNQWNRITAQRLLVEGRQGSVKADLVALWDQSTSAITRAHVLWTLQGLDLLEESILEQALKNHEADLRVQALIASESYVSRFPELSLSIRSLLLDDHPRVRMQAALTLSVWIKDNQVPLDNALYDASYQAAIKSSHQPWVLRALLTAVSSQPLPLLQRLLNNNELMGYPKVRDMTQSLASMEIQRGGDIKLLLDLVIEQTQQSHGVEGLLEGVIHGLEQEPDLSALKPSLAEDLNRLERLVPDASLPICWTLRHRLGFMPSSFQKTRYLQAFQKVTDTSQQRQLRLESLLMLEFMPLEDKEELLFDLLTLQESWEFQEEALRQLTGTIHPDVAQRLIDIWSSLGPQAKITVGNALLFQRDYHPLLLTALESGQIQLGELNFDLERRRMLLFWGDSLTGTRAQKLFSDEGVVTRKQALDETLPALELAGNPQRGLMVFQRTCASCHQIQDMGSEVGPNLSEIYRKSPQTLLHDIVDPNAAADTRYLAYTVENKEGAIYNGILVSETEDQLVVRQMGGLEAVIPRKDVRAFSTSGRSYMTEGLETQMSHQDMADLLSFLGTFPTENP